MAIGSRFAQGARMPDSFEFFKKADTFFQLYYEGKYTEALVLAEKLAIEYLKRMPAQRSGWSACKT